jgi:hypothetical protein
MRKLIPACVAIALTLVAAPAAGAATQHKTETATQGTVTATLTYDLPQSYEAANVKLAITRAGVPATVANDGAVEAVGATKDCAEFCKGAVPVGGFQGGDAKSMTIADLNGDGEPEVIVDLFTGGAHCCSVSAIYGWNATTSTYDRLVWNWGDPGYSLQKLGTGPQTQLVTADDRFAYAFCAYVCSAMPTQVFEYTPTTLVNVTKQYPSLARDDAKQLRKGIASSAKSKDYFFELKGLLAPLCADYYLLGQGSKCKPLLSKAKKRGWLVHDTIWPGGQKYVNDVLSSLRKWGYR